MMSKNTEIGQMILVPLQDFQTSIVRKWWQEKAIAFAVLNKSCK